SGQSAGGGFSHRTELAILIEFNGGGRPGTPRTRVPLMAINPYASCPCGSGKQFKWCCQPYYTYVEKALAQHERGQQAAAEQTMAQLVEKYPNVPQAWG